MLLLGAPLQKNRRSPTSTLTPMPALAVALRLRTPIEQGSGNEGSPETVGPVVRLPASSIRRACYEANGAPFPQATPRRIGGQATARGRVRVPKTEAQCPSAPSILPRSPLA